MRGGTHMKINAFTSVIKGNDNRGYLFPTLRICWILDGGFDWQIGNTTCSICGGTVLLLNNLKTRKIINPNKNHIQIHVLEFLPIENTKQTVTGQSFLFGYADDFFC